MTPRAALISLGTSVVLVLAIAGAACKDDETPARNLSRKGEACNVTNDCAQGLACLPIPGGSIGVCTIATFNVAETAKECAVVECTAVEDCCPPRSATCSTLDQRCRAGDSDSCASFRAICECKKERLECEQNRCVTTCTIDPECQLVNPSQKCIGGRCAQCGEDADCPFDGQSCINGSCRSPCETDGDCAGFARCVTGRCVDSGCQTDRECVAATRNVEARCGTNGKCKVPCQTDLECGNPKDYSFFSCIRNECTYVGCQSDKDCRILLTGPSDASTIGPNEHVVCRDRVSPDSNTIPAR